MKIAAVVPAYNEEQTIGAVIKVLLRSSLVHEIVVVSDGSEDQTAEISRRFPVKVVELTENVGKGGAMKAGTENTDAEVFLFIDADLIGLSETHIADLLFPVVEGDADMSIGVFEEGRFATDFAQKIAPFLSGQRAVKRSLFEETPELRESGFGVEVALSRYAEKMNCKVETVQLRDVSQIMKEEKRGLIKGFKARLSMYWEILRNIKM